MATGVSLETVIGIFGRRGGTSARMLYRAFGLLGVVVDDKLSRGAPPRYAVIAYRCHWALKVDDKVYCSCLGIFRFSDLKDKMRVRKIEWLELPEKLFL